MERTPELIKDALAALELAGPDMAIDSLVYKATTRLIIHTAFIVQAVNSHEGLVAFIEACLDCTSANELHDFVINNADKALDATKEGK